MLAAHAGCPEGMCCDNIKNVQLTSEKNIVGDPKTCLEEYLKIKNHIYSVNQVIFCQ